MFLDIFLAVLAALLVSQVINTLGFLIWWHEPLTRWKAWRNPEIKPQATYKETVSE